MSINHLSPICRFAPSPTGLLHVGNARTAIVNFLYTQKLGGKFILRFDDTDTERGRDEYREAIEEDLKWLGIRHDLQVRQSERYDLYEIAKQKLIESGRLYECYETENELALQRKAQIASGHPPLYNRAALNLTAEQKQNFRNSGLKPHYRFLLDDKPITWNDKVKGSITYSGRHFSDPVMMRDTGVPTYVFCSVVDDIDLKITDIIRGEDHITNTAIQIQIFNALGVEAPHFSHLPLMKTGLDKISKRAGGFDVRAIRDDGIESFALASLLAQTGTSDQIHAYSGFEQLVANFELSKFSKSSCNYSFSELAEFNHKVLQSLGFKQVEQRLQQLQINIDQPFWEAIKANLNLLSDAKDWAEICQTQLRYKNAASDREFLKLASELLPQDTKSAECFKEWMDLLKQKTERKGKELFMPLRLALTGKEHGPEIKLLLPLLAREEIVSRLLA